MDCPGCGKPMIDGQVFNGLLKCHWDCTDAAKQNMGNQNAEDLIQYRINQRLAMEGIHPGHRLYTQLGGN